MSPETWIALGALVVSGLSVAYSARIEKRVNERWRSVNRPRLRLFNPHVRSFGMIDETLVQKQSFPYDFNLFNVDELGPSALRAHGQLLWWDVGNNRMHRGHRTLFTIEEAMSEKARAGLSDDYLLVQYIEFRLPIKNIGVLPAQNIRGAVTVCKDSRELDVQPVGPDIVLPPDEDTTVTSFLGVPLTSRVPDHLDFAMSVQYEDDAGHQYQDVFRRRWLRVDNVWQFPPSGEQPRVPKVVNADAAPTTNDA